MRALGHCSWPLMVGSTLTVCSVSDKGWACYCAGLYQDEVLFADIQLLLPALEPAKVGRN